MNDQLAAVSAYLFLLRRRGVLGDMAEPVQDHLDRLAQGVRMVRSLARSPTPHVAPVSISLLAEAATDAMRSYPDGPVSFVAPEAEVGVVVHCDWSEGLRDLIAGAAWIRRGLDSETTVEVEIRRGREPDSVSLALLGDVPSPEPEDTAPDPCRDPARLVREGPREVLVLMDGR